MTDICTKLRRAHAMGSSDYRDPSRVTMYGEAADEITRLVILLGELTDPDDCWFDHNGGCQAHGYLGLQPGETCPHHDAKEIMRAYAAGAEEREQYLPNTPVV